MDLPPRSAVPLPAFVDDWLDAECAERGLAFEAVALEALQALRDSLGSLVASRTPADANLETWFEAEVDAYGSGVAERVCAALCTLCAQHTGADLATMDREGWRRLPEPSPDQEAAMERLRDSIRRQADAERQMRERSGPLYELSKQRSRLIGEAWRAAGRPRDPSRRWRKELRNLTIPETERFNVYVLPDQIGGDLSLADGSALLERAKHSQEHRGRPIGAYVLWPVAAEPLPTDPKARVAKHRDWLRSIGLTAPDSSEDTPERRAWVAWQRERGRIRREQGW